MTDEKTVGQEITERLERFTQQMQHGNIIQIGSGCTATNDGKHQVEDWCRMCGQAVGLEGFTQDAKRYRFIRDELTLVSGDGTAIFLRFSALENVKDFNEAIDKEMERMGYE